MLGTDAGPASAADTLFVSQDRDMLTRLPFGNKDCLKSFRDSNNNVIPGQTPCSLNMVTAGDASGELQTGYFLNLFLEKRNNNHTMGQFWAPENVQCPFCWCTGVLD